MELRVAREVGLRVWEVGFRIIGWAGTRGSYPCVELHGPILLERRVGDGGAGLDGKWGLARGFREICLKVEML